MGKARCLGATFKIIIRGTDYKFGPFCFSKNLSDLCSPEEVPTLEVLGNYTSEVCVFLKHCQMFCKAICNNLKCNNSQHWKLCHLLPGPFKAKRIVRVMLKYPNANENTRLLSKPKGFSCKQQLDAGAAGRTGLNQSILSTVKSRTRCESCPTNWEIVPLHEKCSLRSWTSSAKCACFLTESQGHQDSSLVIYCTVHPPTLSCGFSQAGGHAMHIPVSL